MRVDSVRIGAVNYAVLETDAAELIDDGRAADISHAHHRIRVANQLPEARQAHLLIHEILHGLFDDSGINLDREREEQLVEALTPRFTALLADNRGAIEALWQMLGVE
jgi:hypothetical protein